MPGAKTFFKVQYQKLLIEFKGEKKNRLLPEELLRKEKNYLAKEVDRHSSLFLECLYTLSIISLLPRQKIYHAICKS